MRWYLKFDTKLSPNWIQHTDMWTCNIRYLFLILLFTKSLHVRYRNFVEFFLSADRTIIANPCKFGPAVIALFWINTIRFTYLCIVLQGMSIQCIGHTFEIAHILLFLNFYQWNFLVNTGTADLKKNVKTYNKLFYISFS